MLVRLYQIVSKSQQIRQRHVYREGEGDWGLKLEEMRGILCGRAIIPIATLIQWFWNVLQMTPTCCRLVSFHKRRSGVTNALSHLPQVPSGAFLGQNSKRWRAEKHPMIYLGRQIESLLSPFKGKLLPQTHSISITLKCKNQSVKFHNT